jgi:hypothetical protein
MSRPALVLAFALTASPLSAQGFHAGRLLRFVRWPDYTTFHTEWAAAVGVTFQGLERDANRRVDVRYVVCCDAPLLQMSVLYAKMFNEDAYGTVGPAASYTFHDDQHVGLLGVEAGLGVEMRRSETRVIALEFGYNFNFPFAFDNWYGFRENETVHGLTVRLIYRRS